MAEVVAPQGAMVAIVGNTKPLPMDAVRMKSVTMCWELMFTRPRFQTPDMIEQHKLLNEVAERLDAGKLKCTLKETLSPINGANLRKAHERLESGTMIDTWATVGSCAQIGKNVHLSGGAGIGGVLEPLQANPVIIEDNCFIGARAEVAEGVIVGEGSVLSMGVYIGQSTKIIDRATGFVHQGRVPPYSVVVSGTMPGKFLPDGSPGPSLYCAVIVKTVDERTRAKTSINELLRD